MGRADQWITVNSNTRSTLGTGTPAPDTISTGWPVGDLLYKRLVIRVRAVTSVNTAMVTDGRPIQVRNVQFYTDKHQNIVENTDGLMLQFMSWYYGQEGQANPVSSTSAADATYYMVLPFEDVRGARTLDLALDMLKSRPTLTLTYGPAADIESTGGTTLSNLDTNEFAQIDPGAVDVPADLPLMMPFITTLKIPINSTATAFVIELPYGDRYYKAIVVSQRNGSTLAALNNTVIGATLATDKVSVKVNGFPFYDRVTWEAIQNTNLFDYQKYNVAKGVGILDFTRLQATGYRLSETLSVASQNLGRIWIEADVTSVSNGQLWIGILAAKPLPEGALRSAPAPSK